MSAPEYWIWLQGALGAGRRCDAILDYFGSPEDLYGASRSDRLLSGVLNVAAADALSGYDIGNAERVIDTCRKNGWSIVTPDSDGYPDSLRNISGYPLVLYVCGDVACLKDELMISIVGTRNVSAYGAKVASSLAFSLAEAGFTVVSGGAIGVDSIAHRAALSAGGRTIAFLGCGLGNPYLKSNAELRSVIAAKGALVSEYLPFAPASKASFPMRNRLISGISLGTVVAEAGVRSGSLITAHAALDQGRDVFSVPGDVTDAEYAGTNELIRDGAIPVFSGRDIIAFYADDYPRLSRYLRERDKQSRQKAAKLAGDEARNAAQNLNKKRTQSKTEPYGEKQRGAVRNEPSDATVSQSSPAVKPAAPEGVSPEAFALWELMSFDPMEADELSVKSGIDIGPVLAALTALELFGAVTTHDGKNYVIIPQQE